MSHTRPLRFVRRGKTVTLEGIAPDRTLLEVLREDLGCTGTKEGCGEGDCGACTVVLGSERYGAVQYQAINSCIRLAHSIDGMALWTSEDLASDPMIRPVDRHSSPDLHPAQQAMVDCHGSQCGFCTPGFVMSLFGMYQNHICKGAAITREVAVEELSGNLCRCTGYRPILDAAQHMGTLPRMQVDERNLLAQLSALKHAAHAAAEPGSGYMAPDTLDELLAARATHPDALIAAGTTDVGLWITKMHRQYQQILDVTRARELRKVEVSATRIRIGAAVTLTDAFHALEQHWPQLHRFASRFAGMPVRNSGTLGGNVANGSPIGDSMPLLIALGAGITLASTRGERSMPIEDFYVGYRKNLLAQGELLTAIDVPVPSPHQTLAAYKISKRFDDDISAVCLVLNLDIENGIVTRARIGAGGVAATPARARGTEAVLIGRPWSEALAAEAGKTLQAEFDPISDMRASSAYRREVLGALLRRFWLEHSGETAVRPALHTLHPMEVPT